MNDDKRPPGGAGAERKSEGTERVTESVPLTARPEMAWLDELNRKVIDRSEGSPDGPEISFRCPFHDDGKASASWNVERHVFKCHGCEESGSATKLAEALGIRAPHQPGGSAPETRYEVRDIDGVLQAVHIRRDENGGKKMWWERPDGRQRLGGRKMAGLPLFGSERLRDLDAGAVVIVCEGEKATAALQAFGANAVGTVTGAASCPSPDILRTLDRFSVYLWPDADEPGIRHMLKVAQSLQVLNISSKTIAWPDAPAKGDAADWVGKGYAADDLAALLTDARESIPAAAEAGLIPQLRWFKDIAPVEINFLWEPYIGLGKLTLLSGDPGVGKSWCTCAMATAVSIGRGLPGMKETAPANVLMLSAEDGLADTIRPRLDQMGADVARVAVIDGPLTLDVIGFRQLEQFIDEVQPRLVILDPFVAFVAAGVDMHRANEIRSVTARLASLAERKGCAIVAVRHLTKGGRDKGIYRGAGSIDLTAAARTELLAGMNPNDPADRAIVHIKSNIGPIGDAIGYAVAEGQFTWGIEPSRLTAAEILGPDGDTPERSAVEVAKEFLVDLLKDGPIEAKAVEREAEASKEFHWRTVQQAKKELGIRSEREGVPGERGGGKWFWKLPPESDDEQRVKSAEVLSPRAPAPIMRERAGGKAGNAGLIGAEPGNGHTQTQAVGQGTLGFEDMPGLIHTNGRHA